MYRRVFMSLLAIGAVSAAAVGYLHMQRDRDLDTEKQAAVKASASQPDQSPAPTQAAADPQAEPMVDLRAASSNEIARLIDETNSVSAATRAHAIQALGSAPKSAALPALRRVLEGGEPGIDRPLALRSLRNLALHQGDEDGAIRTVVREAIYHADDAALVEHAQLALEIIEESALN